MKTELLHERKNRINRRNFLKTAGAAISAAFLVGRNLETKVNSADQTSDTSTSIDTQETGKQEKKKPEYKNKYMAEPLVKRHRSKLGNTTVQVEFYLKEDFWNNLEKGLDKQQLYDKIKEAEFKQKTTTIFKGFIGLHPGPINHEDIIEEFMIAADEFIKMTSNGNSYELDPELKFTKKDKKGLEKLLKENIKSDVQGAPGLLNFTTRYLFPPGSEMEIEKAKEETSISIYTNTNPDYDAEPTLKGPIKYAINTDERMGIFTKCLKLMLLTADPNAEAKDYPEGKSCYIPMDYIFNKYKAMVEKR